MKITYYGHSCFTAAVNGKTLLFDPFISGNPLAGHIDKSKIKADYILISHGHEDHIADAAALAKESGATIISNFEIVTWLSRQGISKGHPMNHGGSWSFDFGKVKMMNAIHSSSFPDGSYAGNPCGFLIETLEGNFYYSGDTALTYDMKLIGEYKKINFALLPVGGNFTMNADNALIAAGFIGCDKIVGLHFDTFGYITINHAEAKEKFSRDGKELILLKIGESINI